MVVGAPSFFTTLPVATHSAVLDGLRVGFALAASTLDEGLHAPAYAAKIGAVIRRRQRLRSELCAAASDVKLPRKYALQLAQLVRVGAQLEHGACLRLTRQLGVDWTKARAVLQLCAYAD